LKNRVSEKCLEIERLKGEMENMVTKFGDRVKEMGDERKKLDNKLKESRKALEKVLKIVRSLVGEFGKEIDTVKSHLRNSKIVFEN